MIDCYAFKTEQEEQRKLIELQSNPYQRPADRPFREVYLPFAWKEGEKDCFGFIDSAKFTSAVNISSLELLAEKLFDAVQLHEKFYQREELPVIYTFCDQAQKPVLVVQKYPGLTAEHGRVLRYFTEEEMERFQQAYLRIKRATRKRQANGE